MIAQTLEYGRLRIAQVATKEVTTLAAREAHVVGLAWNDDGSKIAFTEIKDLEPDVAVASGSTVFKMDLASREITKACHYGNHVRDLVWVGDSIFFRAAAKEHTEASSDMIHTVKVGSGNDTTVVQKHAYGKTNCAAGLAKVGQGEAVVYIEDGMQDQLRILDGRTLYSKKRMIETWHAAFTQDSDEIVLAIAESDTNHPIEVYSTTASGGAMVRLSNHGQAFAGQQFGKCTFLTCPTKDDKYTLECPFIVPATAPLNPDGTPKEPLPAITLIHGGPYSRHSEGFDALYFMWAPYILSAGYAILLVDYRGSSGRGDEWASFGERFGEHDYNDIISQTQAAIDKGWIDQERVAVGGYSQGGFLSYLAITRNGQHGRGWHFKAAIPGAGVSDGDTMCYTSDTGGFEAEVGGFAPWRLPKTDVSNRQMSAIWEFADAVKNKVPFPAVLMLHGEADERVPLEQAVAFRRAMSDARLPFEYVKYPREGHVFAERKHIVDMGERIVGFMGKHIGPGVR